MGSRPSDALFSLVEHAYQPAATFDAWVESVTDLARGIIPEAAGIATRVVTLEPAQSTKLALRIDDARLAAALRAHDANAKHRYPNIVLRGGPGLRRLGADAPPNDAYIAAMRRNFSQVGIAEMCHLTVVDGHGSLMTLGFMMTDHTLPAITARTWTRAAVHLSAAFRLRRQLHEVVDLVPGGAVLSPDGTLLDADGEASDRDARERLRSAVRALDVARARGDAPAALEVWRGLVEGTWSIVDRHDHDGRRYVVAIPNPVHVPDPRALSPREASVAALAAEGYSDKWIAYTLGLSRTTVSSHLHSALRKLALPSRVALASAFSASSRREAETS